MNRAREKKIEELKKIFEANAPPTPPLPGEILRDEGIKQVTEHNEDFVKIMREYAVRYAKENGIVCSDDLHPIATALGLRPKHPNAWGAIFHDKRFRLYGYKSSTKRSRRMGLIRLWRISSKEYFED